MQINNITFRQNPGETKPEATKAKVETTAEDEKSGTSKLLLALGGLATLGVAALVVHKFKGKGANDAAKEIKAPKIDAPEVYGPPEAYGPPRPDKSVLEPEVYGPQRPPIEPLPPRSDEEIKAIVDKFSDILPEQKNELRSLGKNFDQNAALPLEKRQEDFLTNGIAIFGTDEAKIDTAAKLLGDLTRSKFEKIDHGEKSYKEIINDIFEKTETAEQHYRNTGQITLLHVGDMPKLLAKAYKELPDCRPHGGSASWHFRELTNNLSGVRPYRIVYSAPERNAVPGDVITEHRTGTHLFTDIALKKVDNSDDLSAATQKFAPFVDAKSMQKLAQLKSDADFVKKYNYVELLPNASQKLSKSIGIFGKDEDEIASTVALLPELTGAKLQHLDTKDKPATQILEEAKKAQKEASEHFIETGETTLLNLGNLEHILKKASKELPTANEYYAVAEKFGNLTSSYHGEAGVSIVYSASHKNALPKQTSTYMHHDIETNSFYSPRMKNVFKNTAKALSGDETTAQNQLKDIQGIFDGTRYGDIPDSIEIVGSDAEQIDTIVDNLPKITKTGLQRLDTDKSFKDMDYALLNQDNNAFDKFNKLKEKTLLYIGSIEDFYQAGQRDGKSVEKIDHVLKRLIDTPAKSRGLTVIYSVKDKANAEKKGLYSHISLKTKSADKPEVPGS